MEGLPDAVKGLLRTKKGGDIKTHCFFCQKLLQLNTSCLQHIVQTVSESRETMV